MEEKIKMRSFKKIVLSAAAVLTAAVITVTSLAACKPNVVKTEEGKRLTAHGWETNYVGHSEVTFHTDGTLTVTVDDVDGKADVSGKWELDGTTLTAVIDKKYDEKGDLVDSQTSTVYTYADYLSDEIIDNGDESIAQAREKYEKGTQWFVSDKYLYFAGSVWMKKASKTK